MSEFQDLVDAEVFFMEEGEELDMTEVWQAIINQQDNQLFLFT